MQRILIERAWNVEAFENRLECVLHRSLLARRRHYEADDVAPSQGNAHDIADPECEIAGVVTQRYIETRRAQCS